MIRRFLGCFVTFWAIWKLMNSEILVNLSASVMMGGSSESILSYRNLAVGLVLGLCAAGFFLRIARNKAEITMTWIAIITAGIANGTLTLIGTAVDYEANEHSKEIGKAMIQAEQTKQSVHGEKVYQAQQLLDECKRDGSYERCEQMGALKTLESSSALLSDAADAEVDAIRKKNVSMKDAIIEHIGVSPELLQKVLLFSRAIGVSLLISILSAFFWDCLDKLARDFKSKKPSSGGNVNLSRHNSRPKKKGLWLVK